MVWPGGHGIWHGLAYVACYTVWYCGLGMVYGKALRALHMVYGIAWWAWNGMVWRSHHGVWYGLAGIAWYMVWSGEHDMVYGMA